MNSGDTVDTLVIIPPDGGYGWVVLVAAVICNIIGDGAVYSFALYSKQISETYNVHETATTTANSIAVGFYFSMGIISCAMVKRYGFRIIGFIGGIISGCTFLTSWLSPNVTCFNIIYGVIGGWSFGMVYLVGTIAIGFYFDKYRALASAIGVTGSAAGIAFYPLLMNSPWLVHESWQFKFRLTAYLLFSTSFISLLYRPLKPTIVQMPRTPASKPSEASIAMGGRPCFVWCWKTCLRPISRALQFHLLKYPSCFLLAVTYMVGAGGIYIPMTFLLPRARQSGLNPIQCAAMMTMLGACNASGRIIAGLIASIPRVTPLMVGVSSYIICGTVNILSLLCKDASSYYAFACMVGLTMSPQTAMKTPVIVDLFGLENLTGCYGIIVLFQSMAGFAILPICASIIDATGSISYGFLFVGFCLLIAAMTLILSGIVRKWEIRRGSD